jgi:hypothetical protein
MIRKDVLIITLIFFFSTAISGCKKNDSITNPDSVSNNDSITPPAGYKLVWHDEFNTSAIDTSKWNYEVNGDGGGNNEFQYYTSSPENSFIQDNCLVIKALKKSYNGKDYTSARLNSDGNTAGMKSKLNCHTDRAFGLQYGCCLPIGYTADGLQAEK